MERVSSVQIDQYVFAGVRAGDERALERLVRLRYHDLFERARHELGADAARAPRAAEHAVLRAWADRDRLDTPEALERALDTALQQGITVERGRAAAVHRLEAHHHTQHVAHAVTEPTADAAWAHIAAVLHHTPEAPSVHYERMRHGAAQHVRDATRPPKMGMPLLIGGIVAALAAFAFFTVDRSSDELRATSALAATNARVVSTRAAQRANLALDGQTQAALQPDTRITIPAQFGPRLRVAGLDGAALFTVTAGDRPLEVRAGRTAVTTSSGEVAVRAYANEPAAVMVRRGSATVRTPAGTETVETGRAVQVGADGRVTPLDGAARDAALAWTDGRFVAVDRPLRDVLPSLGRWYDLQVDVPAATALDRRVTVRAPLGSSRAVLAALDSGAGLAMEWQGRRMVLRERPR
jgi:ferric-dicitrate binding protein FerR (iron transport regulator)